jgi:NAD(P)-dependent dehydrogenase (short-subunit alcohol dehydrogenase family)
MELNNVFALVTGGGSGIGAETAHHLTKKGIKVAVLDTNAAAAQQVAAKINGLALVADVSNEKDMEQAFQQLIDYRADCRVCIHCAGIAPATRLVSRAGIVPLEQFTQPIQVNLIGTLNVMRLAAHMMSQLAPLDEDNNRGVIINTASIAAFEGQIGQAAYAASKAGVAAMTLPAARELERFGIRVVCIAPGLMDTPLLHNMPTKVKENLHAQTVFPHRLGHPKEFAQLATHIIENNFLNGCVLRLDGGVRLQ